MGSSILFLFRLILLQALAAEALVAESSDRGEAPVFFLGETESGALLFQPIDPGRRAFVWNRKESATHILALPEGQRLLNTIPSTGRVIIVTTDLGEGSLFVNLSKLDEHGHAGRVETVAVGAHPVSAVSARADDGAAWVFIEAIRESQSVIIALRFRDGEWNVVATAKADLSLPRPASRGGMSVLNWRFSWNPPSAQPYPIPSLVLAKTKSLRLLEHFERCCGKHVAMDKEDLRVFRGGTAVSSPCKPKENGEEAAASWLCPVIRCTRDKQFTVFRLEGDGWRELFHGSEPFFPAAQGAPVDQVDQVVDRGEELLLLGHLRTEGSRNTFSLATVRDGKATVSRLRVP